MRTSLLFFLIFCTLALSSQASVYIESGEFGRGILKNRSGECFVITPYHVVEEGGMSSTIFGEQSVRSEAELLKTFPNDLAVLRITGGGEQDCQTWSVPSNFDVALKQIFEGFLEIRERDGSVRPMPISIKNIDDQYITVQPRNFRDKFAKGVSGSSLFATVDGEKLYLGMLQSIDEEDNSLGYVFQADDMESIMGSFFQERRKTSRQNRSQSQLAGSDVLFTSKEFRQTVLGFDIELAEVKKNGTTVTAKFDVTSTDKDKPLLVHRNWVGVYDDKGVFTQANNLRLGNLSSHEVNHNLIQGVTMQLEMTFSGVSSSATELSRLDLSVRSDRATEAIQIKGIIFDLGQPLDGPVTSNARGESLPQGYWSDNVLGFGMSLLNYTKSGNTATFRFRVNTREKDQTLSIHRSRFFIYDDDGAITYAKSVQLADRMSHEVEHRISSGATTDMIITFEGIDNNAQGISLFQGSVNDKQTTREFQIRNLAFGGKEKKITVDRLEGSWADNIQGFDVQLIDYSKTGTTSIFKFSVTSENKDQNLTIHRNWFHMYDEQGNVTQSRTVRIANKASHEVNHWMVQGVPIAVDVTFEGISSAATGVSLFQGTFNNGISSKQFQIRGLEFGSSAPARTSTRQANTSPRQARSTSAKAAPVPEKSNCADIYIYRTNSLVTAEKPVHLIVDNVTIATMQPGTRLRIITCEPNRYEVLAKLDPALLTFAKATIDVTNGGTHYYRVGASAGFEMASITSIREDKGQRAIANNKKFKRPLQVLNW